MLNKTTRFAHYKTLQDGLATLYALTQEREKANPNMNKHKELEAKADKTLEAMVPPALQLLTSTVEALHVIAEAQQRQHPGVDTGVTA